VLNQGSALSSTLSNTLLPHYPAAQECCKSD